MKNWITLIESYTGLIFTKRSGDIFYVTGTTVALDKFNDKLISIGKGYASLSWHVDEETSEKTLCRTFDGTLNGWSTREEQEFFGNKINQQFTMVFDRHDYDPMLVPFLKDVYFITAQKHESLEHVFIEVNKIYNAHFQIGVAPNRIEYDRAGSHIWVTEQGLERIALIK